MNMDMKHTLPRTPIPPNIPRLLPARPPLLRNLLARDPLVIAILPLPHALAHLDPGRAFMLPPIIPVFPIPPLHPRQRQFQVQQFQRPLRPPARRDIDVREVFRNDEAVGPNEGAACGADALLARGSEGDVGGAGVAAGEGPGGFAVADDEDAGVVIFYCLGWWVGRVSFSFGVFSFLFNWWRCGVLLVVMLVVVFVVDMNLNLVRSTTDTERGV